MALLIELATAFLICGLLSFGGGYAMIPIVESELIVARGWLTLATFTEIIAVAEMTPGPVAVNTATFVGYRVGGVAGAAVGTLAVLAVPVLIAGSLAWFVRTWGDFGPVSDFLRGVRPAACALLTAAALTIGRSVPLEARSVLIGGLAAVALAKRVNPLWVIAGSAVLGLLLF